MRIVTPLALVALVLAGCTRDALGPGSGPLLRTDGSHYVLRRVEPDAQYYFARREMTVTFTFTNLTGHDVAAVGCFEPFPPVMQKKVGDGWVDAFNTGVYACVGVPTWIVAGGSYRADMPVQIIVPDVEPVPRWDNDAGDIEGTYRLLWRVLAPATDEQRASNEFTIVPD